MSRQRGGRGTLPSSGVPNTETSTVILAAPHKIPCRNEKPRTNAKNAYARYPLGQSANCGLPAWDKIRFMNNPKEHAHELIERLPPSQLLAVVGLLEAMLDPVSRAIAQALVDDEPLTTQEEKALTEAQEWLKHREPIPHEQVLADLGITQAEIDNYQDRL